MNKNQRDEYWGHLWPEAMSAQGWDHERADAQDRLRRALTLEASANATDSITQLSEDQITMLWGLLKHYADPLNLGMAKAAANPGEAVDEGRRRRYVYKIKGLGLGDGYIQRVAGWDCREAQVRHWTRLPIELRGPGSTGLRRVLVHLTQRANEKRRRLLSPRPVQQPALNFPTGHPVKEYVLKPSPRGTNQKASIS
jgi:hypothetical protein